MFKTQDNSYVSQNLLLVLFFLRIQIEGNELGEVCPGCFFSFNTPRAFHKSISSYITNAVCFKYNWDQNHLVSVKIKEIQLFSVIFNELFLISDQPSNI